MSQVLGKLQVMMRDGRLLHAAPQQLDDASAQTGGAQPALPKQASLWVTMATGCKRQKRTLARM